MKPLWTIFTGLCLLLPFCSAAQTSGGFTDSLHSHHHSDSDLDFVQCHNAVYKINGRPELANGEETRVDPSREYLPPSGTLKPPSPPKQEEDPAASFNQPNFLSVENTFVSPTLQNNYNSLFRKSNNPEPSAAAQNTATNILIPPASKINKQKLSEDEKYSLDRLCKDAFHSFLCKPIKGPRKTPTGRLRPNAVIPPDVLAGLSSFQDETRSRPDPPVKPNPSNVYPQKIPVPIQVTTKNIYTTSPPTKLPANITKNKPNDPEFPSPTNTDSQFLRPEPSNELPLDSAAQTNGYNYERPIVPFPPPVSNPSNQNSQFIYQRPTTTARPTTSFGYSYDRPNIAFPPPVSNPSNQNTQFIYQRPTTTARPTTSSGYSYDRPNIAFPSNNVPQVALPYQSKTAPPHECDKHETSRFREVANPSNDNPSFINPFSPSTQQPLFTPKQAPVDKKPLAPYPSNNFPSVSFSPPTTTKATPTTEDCDKNKPFYPPLFGNPTNQNAVFLKPENSNPVFQISTNTIPKTNFPLPLPTTKTEECDKHNPPLNPLVGNPTNQNPTFVKNYNEKPLSPFPSNTFPRTYPTFKTTPKPSDDCDKHKSPSNPIFGSPTNQNPTKVKPYGEKNLTPQPSNIYSRPPSTLKPTTNPTEDCDKKKPHYHPDFAAPSNQQSVVSRPYNKKIQAEIPKIPSPSNNNFQILTQPQQTISITVKPETHEGYFYEKPAIPFPPPEGYPSNRNPNVAEYPTQKPFTFPTTTSNPNGYVYDQPSIPFASNNIAQIVSEPPQQTIKTPTTLKVPCEHDKPTFYSLPVGNPSNQVSNVFRPFAPSNQEYNNGKNARPTNNFPTNTNNDYINKTPKNEFPSPLKPSSSTSKPSFGHSNQQPFATNIQSILAKPSDNKPSLDAKPQNQVVVAVRPGYTYDKPDIPFDQSPTNDGYSYPRPAIPFIR